MSLSESHLHNMEMAERLALAVKLLRENAIVAAGTLGYSVEFYDNGAAWATKTDDQNVMCFFSKEAQLFRWIDEGCGVRS